MFSSINILHYICHTILSEWTVSSASEKCDAFFLPLCTVEDASVYIVLQQCLKSAYATYFTTIMVATIMSLMASI